MKLSKILIAAALTVFISACSEPQPKLSKLYHDKWSEQLADIGVEELSVCYDNMDSKAVVATGNCLFKGRHYEFRADKRIARIMDATAIRKLDSKWTIHLSDNIQERITLNEALYFLDKATVELIRERKKDSLSREDKKATWQ